MKIKFKKLHPGAVMPKRATDGAADADAKAAQMRMIAELGNPFK